MRVTPSFCETLKVHPADGRFFAPEEAAAPVAQVVIISDGLWKQRYGSGQMIGKSIKLNGVWHSIIGVMPHGWFLVEHCDLWVPLGSLITPH